MQEIIQECHLAWLCKLLRIKFDCLLNKIKLKLCFLVIDIETWFGKKPDSIRPDMAGCEGDVYSPEVCFIVESCFLIKNFPPNIETTHIRYRLDAEIFPGGFGRKVSRIRFGDNRSNSSHSSEKIVAVERTSLTG